MSFRTFEFPSSIVCFWSAFVHVAARLIFVELFLELLRLLLQGVLLLAHGLVDLHGSTHIAQYILF